MHTASPYRSLGVGYAFTSGTKVTCSAVTGGERPFQMLQAYAGVASAASDASPALVDRAAARLMDVMFGALEVGSRPMKSRYL